MSALPTTPWYLATTMPLPSTTKTQGTVIAVQGSVPAPRPPPPG